jgi:hypothetical protein
MSLRSLLMIPLLALLLAAALLSFLGCVNEPSGELVSSRSYSGHESDLDANNFVRAYPAAVGTRLDDCQLCHHAGIEGTSTKDGPGGLSDIENACSYCHLIPFPDTTYSDGVPATYWDTLNDFGQDYMTAGRTQAAFEAIAAEDSDGDLSDNAAEIADNRFPGNPNSKPGNPIAATIELTHAQVAAMTQHSQFLLMNTSRQQYDDYTTYTGPTVKDLLDAAGVDLTGATGISVFAPDGFKKDFSLSNINDQYPDGQYWYVDQSLMDSTLRFVNYPTPIPDKPGGGSYVGNGDALEELWLTIAMQRDGAALDTSYYDAVTGKLEGEGPFRIIPPQSTAGRPDRGNGQPQDGSDITWNYLSSLDHNAGSSVRGLCIIRINPMPADVEEYDTTNGWSLIEDKKIVIYGLNVN